MLKNDLSALQHQNQQLILQNVPTRLLEKLQKAAERNGTSVAQEAARIIETHLESVLES
jgi:hypothetical protein